MLLRCQGTLATCLPFIVQSVQLQYSTLNQTRISLAYCSRHIQQTLLNRVRPTSAAANVSGERYVPNSSHPRLFSTAVHHVISTTSRFEATTNFFFIHYLTSSRLAAPATATVSWSTPVFQIDYFLHPNVLLRSGNPRLQWHFKQHRREPVPEQLRRLHRIPTTFRSCK